MNQPSAILEGEEESSLGSTEIFDAPKGPRPSRPLLAAAIKAREQAEHKALAAKSAEGQIKHSLSNGIEDRPLHAAEERRFQIDWKPNGNIPAEEDRQQVRSTGSDDGEDSSLSSWERDELEDLFDCLESEEEYDANRLYELDLLDKAQSGGLLEGDQAADLVNIKRKRGKERAYRREFQILLDEKEHGRDVDEGRLYFLELFARRHLGDDLSQEEKAILVAAERKQSP
jgi:hypothetical protein